jgi:16S rRNA processing protein RimM
VARQEHLRVGKIVGTHGLQGVLRVYAYAESDIAFTTGRKIRIRDAEGSAVSKKIQWAKPHGKVWLISFEGVTEESMARELVGCGLFLEREALPELDEGTYYWCDLIGLKVYTEDAEFLGCIDAIFPTGSNDVYVVKGRGESGERETLIPALASVVKDVDIEEGLMRVALPEGL